MHHGFAVRVAYQSLAAASRLSRIGRHASKAATASRAQRLAARARGAPSRPSLSCCTALRGSLIPQCRHHTHSQALRGTHSETSKSHASETSVAAFSILTSDPDELQAGLLESELLLHADFIDQPFLVLLVTPSFAHLLDERGKLPQELLTKCVYGIKSGAQVNVLAAVVDALPSTTQTFHHRLGSDAARKTDSEGLSACVSDFAEQRSSLWHDPAPDPFGANSETSASLSFLIELGNTAAASSPGMTYRIKIPLPNTIFQNGSRHTLRAFCYEVQDVDEAGQILDLELIQSRPLLSYNVRLRLEGAQRLDLDKPQERVSLTPFRRVTASMGNILRRLEDLTSAKGEIPASHELEEALKNSKTRPFEVWAEIIPKERWVDVQLGSVDPNLATALQQGRRYSRVLSGGGGWGARAGLLSLDPKSFPGSFENTGTDGVDNIKAELPFVVPDLVRKGDVVRFLLIPDPSEYPSERQSPGEPESTSDNQILSVYEFGTGIREDEMDGTDARRQSKGEMKINNSFGALSVQPASVDIETSASHDPESAETRTSDSVVRTLLPPRGRLTFGIDTS